MVGQHVAPVGAACTWYALQSSPAEAMELFSRPGGFEMSPISVWKPTRIEVTKSGEFGVKSISSNARDDSLSKRAFFPAQN